MAQPSSSQVHVNAVLSNISVAYRQRAEAFIAPQVFPVVPVSKQSDLYYTYDKNAWFRDEAQRRPPNTESAGSGFGISTASYNCDVWAIHKDVDNQLLANTDNGLNPRRDAVELVGRQVGREQERGQQEGAHSAGSGIVVASTDPTNRPPGALYCRSPLAAWTQNMPFSSTSPVTVRAANALPPLRAFGAKVDPVRRRVDGSASSP